MYSAAQAHLKVENPQFVAFYVTSDVGIYKGDI